MSGGEYHHWSWRGDFVATSDATGALTPAALTDAFGRACRGSGRCTTGTGRGCIGLRLRPFHHLLRRLLHYQRLKRVNDWSLNFVINPILSQRSGSWKIRSKAR